MKISEHIISNENGTEYMVYHTGIALELPKGYDAIVIPRSSVRKTGMIMANSVGYIDNDYRGEIQVSYKIEPFMKQLPNPYLPGDRVCQIRLVEQIKCQFEVVDKLSDTERGEGGFGSTGK
jgi:dUTP pyrophosphatase